MRTPNTGSRAALACVVLAGTAALAGCGGSSSSQPGWVNQTSSASSTSASAGQTTTVTATATGTASGTSAAATPSANQTVKVTEPDAKAIQRELMGMNYDLSETGVYDAATRAAIKRFQANHHLPVTGVVDANTAATMGSAFASFRATSTRTDADGYVFDGAYWRADDYYRSKNRQCVVYEQAWQQAVDDNSNSRSVSAHDSAAALGCNPDSWTPSSWYHATTQGVHTDGQPCSSDDKGTIAQGTTPWTVCNEVSDNVFEWKAMPN